MAKRTRRRLPAQDELELLLSSSAAPLERALSRVEVARIRGDDKGRERAERELGRLLADLQGAADLLGRRRLLLEAQAATGRKAFADEVRGFVPAVPFGEAAEDVLRRYPVLAPGWRATASAYEAGGFAAARAASALVAERIQEVIVRAVNQGTIQWQAERAIVAALETGADLALDVGIDPAGFTRAYSETVFRTNVASAYARGRIEQAQDPAFRSAIGAWRFVTAGDEDTRGNHAAADGLVAALDDPVWSELRPPLGYNCRCALELVPRAEALAAGAIDPAGNVIPARVPPGATADRGFRAGA